MNWLRLVGAVAAFGLAAAPALSQTAQTRAQLEAGINSTITSNGVGAVTGQILNGQLQNLAASMATGLDPNTLSQPQTMLGVLTYGGVTFANSVTGTGSIVLSASPTITGANLGTPTALSLTNATGLPVSTGLAGLGTGVGTLLGGAATGTGGPAGSISPTITGTLTLSSLASSGTSCVQASSAGVLSLTGAMCGSGGAGAVNTVSNSDGTLTISPTTGAVVASITHPSVTLGSTSVALGATATTLAGLTSVTSTALVGALTGHASLDLALSSLGTGVATALGNAPNAAGGLSAVGPVFDVVAKGASPSNSASANVTAFQAAFTAAATANGSVHIPCGVYSLNAALTATIASKGALSIRGDGQDCVQLSFAAGSNGITITETDQFGSALVSDLSLVTADTTGSFTALTLTSSNTFPAGIAYQTNVIRNVVERGADAYASSNSDYWGVGTSISNVSYNTIDEGAFWGSGTFGTVGGKGTAVNIAGISGSSSYSVVTNIHGLQAQFCNIGVNYGTFVQGVTINGGSNFTYCITGVQVYTTSTGTADQLVVEDSQFNCTTAISATQMIGLGVHHNTIISSKAGNVGISGVGSGFSIDHNWIQSQSTSSTIGILVNGIGTLLGGSINDNTIQGYGIGISNTVGTVSLGTVHDNTMYQDTINYSISTGTFSFVISDPTAHPASAIGTAMPTCAAQYAGARFTVDDQTTVTFLATVNATSGSSSGWGQAICNGTNYQFH